MFTGIVEATALVKKKASPLVLERPEGFDDLKIGMSICVSGVCLSVTSFTETTMTFDVTGTTRSKSTMGGLKPGDRVNLERALRADGRFDGHIVLGHCEGTGTVIRAPTHDPSPAAGEGGDVDRVCRGVNELKYPPRILIERSRGMRRSPTDAEAKLWNAIRGRRLSGLYFRRQRPIGTFIVDFYCETLRLGIEVDGGIHRDRELKEYERYREENLGARGVSLLRFTNKDIMMHLPSVLDRIARFRPVQTPLSRFGRGDGGEGTARELVIDLPSHLLPFVVPHGSIAINGVSLTVATLDRSQVTVALIPQTLEHTNLGSLKPGASANLETDILGRYILNRPHAKERTP